MPWERHEKEYMGNSPYNDTELMLGTLLGLPVRDDVTVNVERWDEKVTDLDTAREIYRHFGAVVLGSECQAELGKFQNVGDFANNAGTQAIEQLQDFRGQIQQKDYSAYNETPRHLWTIAPGVVKECLPDVLEWQEQLLPIVRHINNKVGTEISTDPFEGTVVNLQLFHSDGDTTEQQEHGAHTDRVDTTTIVCLDNVGPNGELVFIKNYNLACRAMGLSPHRTFANNLRLILDKDQNRLVFRMHDVRPGSVVMVESARDVHFITPKTLGDVQQGVAEGHSPHKIGGLLLGRGIINMAFETPVCRRADRIAKSLEERTNIHALTDTDVFFAALDEVVKKAAKDQAEVYHTIVTRRSAEDLY